jgi:hypothetical protein
MRLYKILSFCIVSFVTAPAALADCLDDAANYTDRICGEILRTGSSSVLDASGNLNIEAKGIISKVFGTAGGNAVVRAFEDQYTNVPRDQLARELASARGCRERIEAIARQETCRRPVVYKKCRHPDFGQEGWASQDKIEDATGWRGGWTQPAFCNEAINKAIVARGISGQPYDVKVLRSWENGKWDNPTLRIGRKYRYHCEFQLNWNPVYFERQDPKCGILTQ